MSSEEAVLYRAKLIPCFLSAETLAARFEPQQQQQQHSDAVLADLLKLPALSSFSDKNERDRYARELGRCFRADEIRLFTHSHSLSAGIWRQRRAAWQRAGSALLLRVHTHEPWSLFCS